MFEIDWKKLGPDTHYYAHDKYVFKRRKVKEYFVYSIWENNEMMFNTYNQWDFLRRAKSIMEGRRMNWGPVH